LTELTPQFGAEPEEPTEPTLPGVDPAEPVAPVPFPVPDEVADYSPEDLAPSLAALCFALNRPVTLPEAAAILGRSESVVAAAATHLATTLRGGGLMLQRHQDELQLVTRPEVAWAVQRALNPEKPGRLSRAALETLAIVAYRQPLTRAGIEVIRGVNCEAVLDSLERRGLIAEVGRQDTPGHPRLFGTTLRFLQVVGLEGIGNLPPLPEGLKVPELPVAGWDVVEEPEPEPEPEPDHAAEPHAEPDSAAGSMEVRGEAVPTDTSGYTTGATRTHDAMAADPDEGYGEAEPEDAADDPPDHPGPQAEA
jgi:segregation and condensation protein B